MNFKMIKLKKKKNAFFSKSQLTNIYKRGHAVYVSGDDGGVLFSNNFPSVSF